MRKIITVFFLLFAITAFSQSKNERATLLVDGVCLMCKDRIEKACFKTKGVKSAVWEVHTHKLKLIYNARKTNLDSIEKSVVAVGHDTQKHKATDAVYNALHGCCKYRDEEVRNQH